MDFVTLMAARTVITTRMASPTLRIAVHCIRKMSTAFGTPMAALILIMMAMEWRMLRIAVRCTRRIRTVSLTKTAVPMMRESSLGLTEFVT